MQCFCVTIPLAVRPTLLRQDGYGIFKVHTNLGACHWHTKKGVSLSGTNKGAQEFTWRDRKTRHLVHCSPSSVPPMMSTSSGLKVKPVEENSSLTWQHKVIMSWSLWTHYSTIAVILSQMSVHLKLPTWSERIKLYPHNISTFWCKTIGCRKQKEMFWYNFIYTATVLLNTDQLFSAKWLECHICNIFGHLTKTVGPSCEGTVGV